MKSDYGQQPLQLLGGVVQAQRLVVPTEVIARLGSWRQACRLAWKLRRTRMSQRTFAELTGCYAPHVSDYFSVKDRTRCLPAEKAAIAGDVLGNTVLIQYLAHQASVNLLEELQVQRQRRAA